MIKKNPAEMRKQGFIIDATCYPWFAYKGPRFMPTDWFPCLTDFEAELLRALEDVLAELRAHHPMKVKKDFSLMTAEAAARAVIHKIKGEQP
jgi:hypothetical protein